MKRFSQYPSHDRQSSHDRQPSRDRQPSCDREGAVGDHSGSFRSLTVAARICVDRSFTVAARICVDRSPTVAARIALGVVLLACCVEAATVEDLAAREQAAFQDAVARVAPSVVRIETVGGSDRLGKVSLVTGPTTGLILAEDGLIVSSSLNFLGRPDSILVQLPDGTRKPARLVATDHSRGIALLAIDADGPLPVPEAAPRAEMRVGQWAIALGRTFEANRPNVSVGIVSALSRLGGRAIQTDAAVSPNNYGGPLVDVRGRVLGVLTPLSPNADDETAGVEWYDSGIGFAVPAEDIFRALPRLRRGENLRRGRLGVSFTAPDPNTAEPVVAACHPLSPAYKALKRGDRVVAVDGMPIARVAELEDALGPRYAGDPVTLTIEREGKRREERLTLVAELPPYERPLLGILPQRDAPAGDGPVGVRFVFPNSPAAKARIESGDAIVSLGGKPLAGAEDLRQRIALLRPGDEIALEVLHPSSVSRAKAGVPGTKRSGVPEVDAAGPALRYGPGTRGSLTRRSVVVRLGRLSDGVHSGPLPAAREKTPEQGGRRPNHGKSTIAAPEIENKAWVYVPEGYDPAVGCGVVVWLDAPGGVDDEAILRLWRPACNRDGLILLAVKPVHAAAWLPSEEAAVGRLLDEVVGRYEVDANRIVVHGHQGGGTLAALVAVRHRELIRAVVAVDAPLAGRPPAADPMRPLAFYLWTAAKSPQAERIERSVKSLGEARHPVVVDSLGDTPRYLQPDEIDRLAKWIDMLDRI